MIYLGDNSLWCACMFFHHFLQKGNNFSLPVCFQTVKPFQNLARGYKILFMLDSVGHEILKAHKYKNIKKFRFFQTQISRECYFSCS